MTGPGAFTAARVADRLRGRLEAPWEAFGERLERYEMHLAGGAVEMTRGPIRLEGFGVRVFRPHGEATGVGFSAGTDLSDGGIDARAAAADETARFARFPTARAELPSTHVAGAGPSVETVDARLWDRPADTVAAWCGAILEALAGRPGVVLSFGSVRATLTETTLANSEGIQRHWRHTFVDFEAAVKSFDGPEGPAPGEYWVNGRSRTVPTKGIAEEADRWVERARDTRRARPTPSGLTRVVLPPGVLADILPTIVGYRFSGAAELRGMAPSEGAVVGTPSLTVHDNGLRPWGLGSAPFDDEGTPPARRALIDRGRATTPVYDVLHAGATGHAPTGNGRRESHQFSPWFHFDRAPGPTITTLEVAPGDAGTDAELAEAVGEGLWVDQLGYAFPDAISAAFGGEVRIGYRIHRGRLAEPVRGGTVGGVVVGPESAPSLFGGIRGLGSTEALVGYLATPPIWSDGLTVAGAE
ncbi:MAG TPA: TldD/PmbA family protein [Thermoplasmata archaeon]|nr:TldD/PmbA family protein [Thermoplasmata archaeon]